MAPVVGVHGIGNEYHGESTMFADWYPAMSDGMTRSGATLATKDLTCAFYGDLFREKSRLLSGAVWYSAEDVREEVEAGLVQMWWEESSRWDHDVISPGARTLARTPRAVQRALDALSGSKFFAGLAGRMMILSLKQVQRYFTDDDLREEAVARVARAVTGETRVLVGHSLGSVVAYEALCANPDWPVRRLVTLGSPLGIRNLIFDRLRPEPDRNGMGCWPGAVSSWINIMDDGDIVALRKDLRPCFGPRVSNIIVQCGSRAHDAGRYLTSEAVGAAIAGGLAGG